MKKLFLLLSILLFCTNVLADKMTKDGFLSNNVSYSKDLKISNPENKILLIYNHGQSSHDGPSSDCVWKGGMKNMASLVGQKVNCKVWGNAIKDFHDIDRADCFEYYNSAILNFINSKLN